MGALFTVVNSGWNKILNKKKDNDEVEYEWIKECFNCGWKGNAYSDAPFRFIENEKRMATFCPKCDEELK